MTFCSLLTWPKELGKRKDWDNITGNDAIAAEGSHGLIAFQWRESAAPERGLGQTRDLLHPLWDFSHSGKAQDHYLQEPVQESVSNHWALPLELQPEDYPENAPTAPAQAGLRAGREVWYKEKIKHPRKCQNKCPVFRAIVFNCSKGFLMKLKGRRSYKSHLTIILDKDEEILSVGAVPRKP